MSQDAMGWTCITQVTIIQHHSSGELIEFFTLYRLASLKSSERASIHSEITESIKKLYAIEKMDR